MDPGTLKKFETALGADALLRDADSMRPFLREWRGAYTGRAAAVLLPSDTAQVSRALALCHEHRIGVVPQSGNTGLSGGAAPGSAENEVVLSLTRMNRIRAMDRENFSMTAEAGCVLQAVRDSAAAEGRFFPLSLAAQGSACIGGLLATNAGGTNVLRYGSARNLALGVEVVLADGRVWDGLSNLRKDNTGYDLRDLFIGSEGTLGVITAATLRLFPLPGARHTAWISVPDAQSALNVFTFLNERWGTWLSACELLSGTALDFVLRHVPGTRAPVRDGSPWYLLVELDGPDQVDIGAVFENALGELISAGTASDAVVATSLSQADALWRLRESISEAQRAEGASLKHDISVPVSKIPELIARLGKSVSQRWPGTRPCVFGHLGDGNLHYNISQETDADPAEFRALQQEISRLVYDETVALGGSFSAEHGIGRLKRDELARYKSPVEIALLRSVKRALDPAGIMNPGKVIPEDEVRT